MKIFDKYILNQTLASIFIVTLIATVVWISPEILPRLIRQISHGEISQIEALKVFFLLLPEIIGKVIPAGVMIGTLIIFDKLSKTSELVILRGVGLSIKRLLFPVVLLSIIATILVFCVYEFAIPYSSTTIRNIKQDVNHNHFVYVDKQNGSKPSKVFIINDFDGVNIKNVKLLSFSNKINNDTPIMDYIIISNKAEYKNNNKWLLSDGIEYKIAPDGVFEYSRRFNNKLITLSSNSNNANKLLNYSNKIVKEMNILKLNRYIELLKSENLNDELRPIKNDLFTRFSIPISCILLAITGAILGINRPRETRFLGYVIAAGVLLLYFILTPFFTMLTQIGILSPFIAAWLPCLLLAIGIIYLYRSKRF